MCFQQLGSEDDHTRRSVAHFLVLQIRQLHQHLRGGVLHFQLLKDRRAVICNGNISDFVHLNKEWERQTTHQHLVETNRTQRALYNIGDGHAGSRCGVTQPHCKTYCFVF